MMHNICACQRYQLAHLQKWEESLRAIKLLISMNKKYQDLNGAEWNSETKLIVLCYCSKQWTDMLYKSMENNTDTGKER